MNKITIHAALSSLRPKAEWTARGDEYEGIQWLDKTQTMPTREEIRLEIQRLEAQAIDTEYQRLRAREYPSIGDQLDALFHAGAFPPEMAAKIQAIKDKFPKS